MPTFASAFRTNKKFISQARKNYTRVRQVVGSRVSVVKEKGVSVWRRFTLPILAILGVGLMALIVAARLMTQPEPVATPSAPAPLEVQAVTFGQTALSESTYGTVKNLTSITLVAQSSGPVSDLKVVEGQPVAKGEVLLRQTSAYAAGNAATVQRQIAAKGYQLSNETFSNTQQTVAKTREQADLNRDNSEEMRKIIEASLGDTRSLITTTEQVVEKIEQDITNEQNGANNPNTIQGFRQQLISFRGVLNQNRSALRSAEYEANADKPPAKLAQIQKDLVYLSTDLQLKSAQINKDIAGLNLRLAHIQEASTRVAAPFAGSIEKVYVQPGQHVTPGTPVIKIKGDTQLTLQIAVSGALAAMIDSDQSVNVQLGDNLYYLPLTHVSSTPINGQMYEVMVVVPSEYERFVFEGQSLAVQLPLYNVSIDQGNYFLPLDAVFITNAGTYVMVAENNVAVRKPVVIGEITGDTVEVKDGLIPGQQVILDRRVIEGQQVTIIEKPVAPTTVEERG